MADRARVRAALPVVEVTTLPLGPTTNVVGVPSEPVETTCCVSESARARRTVASPDEGLGVGRGDVVPPIGAGRVDASSEGVGPATAVGPG